MTRKFELRKATQRNVPLLIGLVGPSSSGKTYSALRLAAGIQKVVGGKLAVIDTEAGRASHYLEDFSFEHMLFTPPFGPLDYLGAFKQCVEEGARVIVADSMTHEHSGEGGVLEQHDSEQQRLAKAWNTSLEATNAMAWDKPKAGRRKMMNYVLQSGVHLIACYRGKQKLDFGHKENGKTKPKKLGLMPEGDESFVYEMTVNCLLRHASNGVPDWNPREPGERLWVKRPGWGFDLFEKKPQLSEEHGESLARWATGSSLGTSRVELSELFIELSAAVEAADFIEELDAMTDRMKAAKSKLSPREFGQLRKSWGARRDELKANDADGFEEEPTGT